MLVYEYKRDGSKKHSAAIEETIRIVQFIHNKSLRLWMDNAGTSKNDICRDDSGPQTNGAVLAKEYPFARRLNSMDRQASADRAWFAISRFYDNCKQKKPGKYGYPRFQHKNCSDQNAAINILNTTLNGTVGHTRTSEQDAQNASGDLTSVATARKRSRGKSGR